MGIGELSLEPNFSTCDGSLHSTVVIDFSSTILLFSFSSWSLGLIEVGDSSSCVGDVITYEGVWPSSLPGGEGERERRSTACDRTELRPLGGGEGVRGPFTFKLLLLLRLLRFDFDLRPLCLEELERDGEGVLGPLCRLDGPLGGGDPSGVWGILSSPSE